MGRAVGQHPTTPGSGQRGPLDAHEGVEVRALQLPRVGEAQGGIEGALLLAVVGQQDLLPHVSVVLEHPRKEATPDALSVVVGVDEDVLDVCLLYTSPSPRD